MESASLPVEPDVFEPKAVENAIDDQVEPFNARPPASRGAGVKDDRARGVARQATLDLPHQLPAPVGVWLARLSIDRRVNLFVAVARGCDPNRRRSSRRASGRD